MTPKQKNDKKVNKKKKWKKELSTHSIENTKNIDNLSGTSMGSSHSNPSPCGHCRKLVKNDDSAMECEICKQWYHVKCQNISKAEYNYIKGGTRKVSLSRMHWHCLTYDRVAINFMKTMTSLHAKQEKI